MDLRTNAAIDVAALQARAKMVLDLVEEVIASLETPIEHRLLLGTHVAEGRSQIAASPVRASVQISPLVYAALGHGEAAALPLAAAGAFVYLGADLFDNVVDQELSPIWAGFGSAEIMLAAATLISAMPPLALARLSTQNVSDGLIWQITHKFAAAIAAMSAGQHHDLSFQGRPDITPSDVRGFIERQSGGQVALFAETAAMLADAPPPVAAALAAFGVCLGSAGQIVSDIGDILDSDISPDLLNGRRTLPIVYALASSEGDGRLHLLELLDRARQDPSCHSVVRQEIQRRRGFIGAVLAAEAYINRGHGCLSAAGVRGPAAATLHGFLDLLRLVPQI